MSTLQARDKEQQYRVFISYSHQDYELVQKIAFILEEVGVKPMWDQNFARGRGFYDQIRDFISHAHVFLPVITSTSDERRWVHQEIGYAMALNIPVLPIAVGRLPGEMLHQIHAVQWSDDIQQVKKQLSREVIASLVQHYLPATFAFYQCAYFPEDRAKMMAQYCNKVRAFGVHDLFRQKGALSSLHIPNKTHNHPVWRTRYGGSDRGESHCILQREERRAVEEHARIAGCRLIVNPHLPYERYPASARIVRLECLLEFLESIENSKCQVAFNRDMDYDQSLTILGDWFFAESVSAKQSYRQTIFTSHAPSMLGKIEAFDQEFDELLEDYNWKAETSRAEAINEIRKIIAELRSASSAAG